MCIKSLLVHSNFIPTGKNNILDVKAGKLGYNWSEAKTSTKSDKFKNE